MINTLPLKQIFEDNDYAWKLLQSEMNLETDTEISGDDISLLLQLYMRGVERMNSFMDSRESFFKNRVTGLMAKPTVVKILNKSPMKKKKKKVDTVNASSSSKKKKQIKTPPREKNQIQLQQKKKEMEMRLAYGVEESSPETVKKMLADQGKKQKKLEDNINKIINSHDERLMKRIQERKIRTLTAKSRSQVYMKEEINGQGQLLQQNGQFNGYQESNQFGKGQIQFGKIMSENEMIKRPRERDRKAHKSLQTLKTQHFPIEQADNKARRVSMEFFIKL